MLDFEPIYSGPEPIQYLRRLTSLSIRPANPRYAGVR